MGFGEEPRRRYRDPGVAESRPGVTGVAPLVTLAAGGKPRSFSFIWLPLSCGGGGAERGFPLKPEVLFFFYWYIINNQLLL